MTLSLVGVQSELLTLLKEESTILNELSDPKEIREIEWVGAKFSYPNIRVRVETFKRIRPDCDIFDVTGVVLVFGDNASSMKTNTVAGAIFNFLDKKQIHGTLMTTVSRVQANQLGAEWVQEAGVWRSAVELQFQAK